MIATFVCVGFALPQDRDLAIDAEHVGHLRLEFLVAPFEIVADLVRLDLMAGEDFADRALSDACEAGMSGGAAMLAGVARQQPRRPKLVRIAEVLGFLAGQRHQPSLALRP